MMRRMFASMFLAAPVAAAGMNTKRASGMLVDKTPPAPSEWMIKETIDLTRPAGIDDYYRALGAARDAEKYRRTIVAARHEVKYNGMPISIDCLRSVSPQHKFHMMAARAIENEQASRTFAEMLMDKFGVREWLVKRNGEGAQEAGMSTLAI